jgi:hypothetical protein
VPIGILVAVFLDRSVHDAGAFADGDHGVVGGVGGLVLEQVVGEQLRVERHLGDERPVDAGQVGGEQRRLAAVPPEQLHHGDPLV